MAAIIIGIANAPNGSIRNFFEYCCMVLNVSIAGSGPSIPSRNAGGSDGKTPIGWILALAKMAMVVLLAGSIAVCVERKAEE